MDKYSHYVHIKRYYIKEIVLSLSLIMLVFGSYYSTFAKMKINTNDKINNFGIGTVECTVDEKFDNIKKQNVRVQNTGTVDEYMRVCVVINLLDDNGCVIAKNPEPNVDYTIIFPADFDNNWKVEKGFYYCKKYVKPNEFTPILISSIESINKNYTLDVQVLTQSIQANPNTAISNVWNVNLNS